MTDTHSTTVALSAADANAWATMKSAGGEPLRNAALTQARLHPSVGVGILAAAFLDARLPGKGAAPALQSLRADSYARAKAWDTGIRGVFRRFGPLIAAPAVALAAFTVDASVANPASSGAVTGLCAVAAAAALWPIVLRATQPLALPSRAKEGQEAEIALSYGKNRIALGDAAHDARSLAIAGITSATALLSLGHGSAAAILLAAGVVAVFEAARLRKARLLSDGELVLLIERLASAERLA